MDFDTSEHDGHLDFDTAANEVGRHLVSLRIGNEVDADGEPINAYTYRPSNIVTRMHRAPRGRGHTNSLASILEETSNGGNDYVGGLKLFAGAFIITPFVLWFLMIVSVKLRQIYVSRKESNTGKDLPTPKTVSMDDPNSTTPSPASKEEQKKQKIPVTPWIAGGQVIDMYKLSRAKVSRKDRKRLVIQSWKIQSTFLSVSIFIPVLSVVLLECGWKPLEVTMQEIQELNSDVESLAYRGRDATDRLQSSKREILTDNELIRSILEHSNVNEHGQRQRLWQGRDFQDFVDHNNGNRRAQFFNPMATSAPADFFLPLAEPTTNNNNGGEETSSAVEEFLDSSSSSSAPGGIFTEEWCPDAIRLMQPTEYNYWVESMDYLTEKTQRVYQIFDALEGSFLPVENPYSSPSELAPSETASTFEFVTDATTYVDELIDWYLANDWLLKMLVLVLNVVNGLLLANVYFVSKNNIIHQPTRLYVAYILLPIFVVAATLMVAVTVASGFAILINSDFCSGGSEGSGPQGTIEEAISTLQAQKELNGEPPNEALGLVYDAIDYYWKGCLSENPLEFLEDFTDEIDDAAARVNEFTAILESADLSLPGAAANSSPLSILDKACQRDMSFLEPSIHDLKRQVDQIRTSVHKLSDTMSCAQVSPLFRRVSHGAVCVDSPQRLAALWGASFGISILCFVLLTYRAALYNSVKYKKRRPTKPRRIVEKEFDEYKEFMGKYYGENTTKKWKIDGDGVPVAPTKLELEFDEDIELKGTFDTAKSSTDSGDDASDGSENAGIFVRKIGEDDSSYGSSYDSECSDDEKSIDSGNGESTIGSILSQTKSIAMQTIHSLRSVRSLLSASKSKKNPPSHIGHTAFALGSPKLDDSDEEDYGNEVFFAEKPKKAPNIATRHSETKSIANSISDDSLYLPTPTTQSATTLNTPSHAAKLQERKRMLYLPNDNDNFFDEEDVDDDDIILANHSRAMGRLRTAMNPISALSPLAPRKPLSFLARTLYSPVGKGKGSNYTEEELASLVKPKQLANLNSFGPKRRAQEPEGRRHDNSTRVRARNSRSSGTTSRR